MAAGEYLPPLVTELKADWSDLAKGFAEAKKLQQQYKRDVEGLNETQQEYAKAQKDSARATTDLEHAVVLAGRRMREENDSLGESTKKYGKNSTKAYRETREEVAKTSKEVAEFDRLVKRHAREGESAVATLRREYERLTSKVSYLKREMGKGGSSRRGFQFGSLREATSDLSSITRMGRELGVTLGETAAKGFISSFGGMIGKGIDGIADLPFVKTAIAAVIAGAIIGGAPIIGGALATVLTAGLGLGVLGFGAYILKDDKDIKKAGNKLAKTTSGVFKRAAAPLKETFVDAIGKAEKKFPKLEKPLKGMFAAAKPLLNPIGAGIFGAIEKAMPGITQALKNAQPMFETIGKHLPNIGIAVGEFFRLITENKDELAQFAGDTIDAVSGVIIWLGEFIGWLTKAYVKVKGWYTTVTGVFTSIKKWLGEFFTGLGNWIFEKALAIGNALGLGIQGGIGGQVKGTEKRAGELANAALKATAKKLGVKSPSTEFAHLGKMSGLGYANGLNDSAPKVWDSLARMMAPGTAARASVGYDAALAMSRPASRPAGGGQLQPVVLELDGRVLARTLVPYTERAGLRNAGTSGLGNRSNS